MGIRVPLEILEADPVPAAADQRVERAQRFGGDVLEDEFRYPGPKPQRPE